MQLERRLSDWLDAFMQCTENSEPSPRYRLWTGIGVVAAALQRKCVMEWDTEIYPNMYICLVGPPAARKGTAMGPGARLLRAVGIPIAAEAITMPQLVRRMTEINNTEHDTTTGEMIMHSSFTVFSAEFTVFLGYQNSGLIATLCNLYDCEPQFRYETKNMGKDEIIGPWLNILGATTPTALRMSLPLEAIGGGLASRMIFVYADGPHKKISVPIRTQSERMLFEHLKIDLEKILLMKGRFKITEGFLRMYSEWYENSDKIHLGEHLEAYVGRRSLHLRKLCMILSASRGSSMVIDENDFQRAVEIIEEAERYMPLVFSGVGHAETAELMPRVMRFLAEREVTSYQDLIRRFYQDADRQTMDRLLQTLDAMDYIQISQPSGNMKYTGPKEVYEALSTHV